MFLNEQQIASSPVLAGLGASALEQQADAVEAAVRSYTNNNFRVRESRIFCDVVDGKLVGVNEWFQAGDRIEIVDTWNRGLYNVASIEGDTMALDSVLRDGPKVLVYRVEYPKDVISGLISMLEYDNDPEVQRREGVASETLSRHTVQYVQLSGANQTIGYPSEKVSFLSRYHRARF